METANLPSVVSLGLKPSSQLEPCKNFVNTTYTVGVGQSIFTKPIKPESIEPTPTHTQKLEDADFDYDIEYSTEHVPLGEILERLQNEERYEHSDRSNLIRLHAVNDSSAATISATLNFATLDLSSQSSLHQHLSEINDVLFSINKTESPSENPTTTSATFSPASTLSPHAVPEVTSIFTNSSSPSSSDESAKPGLINAFTLSPQPLTHGYETKTSPQECNLCNKMFGNASALAKHRLTHSDERKYLCNVCHKAFKRQDHLNGHLLTHRNKKPFECTAEGCNKSYCDARSLRRHRENHHSSKDEKLVSPASSITSSDFDEKSLGSESCDGSLKGTKLVFTGINSLEKDKLKMTNDTRQFQLIEQIIRETKESEASNAKIQNSVSVHNPTFQTTVNRTNVKEPDPNQNMVECSICSRKFKNIPALNGHMRLHGGYYRKDNEKKHENKIVTTEPVSTHTVSSNVRALIEEKIIQKRKLEPTVLRPSPQFATSPTQPKYQPINLPTCSTSPLCSTSRSVTNVSEPPNKRLALESNNKSISSLDNLVFPVLPQPDTSKLLANLQNKTPQISNLLPASPLPSIPLPNERCGGVATSPVNNIKETQVKSAHQHKLLKIQRTNFQPSIGEEFQAVLPECKNSCEDTKYGILLQETLMWSPRIDKFPETHLEAYLKLASSSAVKEYGNNTEHALSILLQCNGNIIKATQALLGFTKIEESSSLNKTWTAEEVDMFYEALCKHKKDFAKISGDLPNKSTKDCVEFYYLWKNICREESQSFKSIINATSDNLDSTLLAI